MFISRGPDGRQKDHRKHNGQLTDCSENQNFTFPGSEVSPRPHSSQICLPLFQKVKYEARTSPAWGRRGVGRMGRDSVPLPAA